MGSLACVEILKAEYESFQFSKHNNIIIQNIEKL
jgi:hypothetical protein